MVPFRAKKRVFRYIGKSAMYRVLRFVTWGGTQFLGLFSVHTDVPNYFSVHPRMYRVSVHGSWGHRSALFFRGRSACRDLNVFSARRNVRGGTFSTKRSFDEKSFFGTSGGRERGLRIQDLAKRLICKSENFCYGPMYRNL